MKSRLRKAVQRFVRTVNGNDSVSGHDYEIDDGDERFHAIFEMAAVGIAQQDPEGRWMAFNQRFCEIVGFTAEELRGRVQPLTHPDERDEEAGNRARLVRGEIDTCTCERRYVRKDERVVWVNVTVSLVRNRRGEPKYFIAIVQDIDRRRRAEAAGRENKARLQVALEAASMGTWERNLITGKDQWSEQQQTLFGLEPGAFDHTHATFLSLVHPDDRARLEETARRAIEQRIPYRSEYRAMWPDGGIHWMAGRGDVFYDDSGKPTHMVGVTLDITDRKRAETERQELLIREQRARAEAETANRRKDQFLAVLSHELRTPLTPVIARLALLKRDPHLTPDLEAGLDMIRRNVELEARLIEDLLDMTRITRGTLRLNREAVDVHARIRNALEIYQQEISKRRLEVRLDLRAENPSVLADPARIQQVFWNLVSNAVKYTPPGGTITVRTYNRDGNGDGDSDEATQRRSDEGEGAPDSALFIEIIDTGIGIEPAIMQRLFDPFEQGEQTLTRRYGGLGLGLSISRTLVQMHGGTLTARTEGKDKGSTFTVELKTLAAPEAEQPVAAAPPRRPHLRILLVEDNEDTLHVMARLLKVCGYEVREAASVRSALDLAEHEDFDLLISDIGLPDGSGWELMSELRARRPLRGIALSGFSMDEDIQKSQRVGFLAHLAKPVNPQELEEAIQKAAS